jgi:hypothetical protein
LTNDTGELAGDGREAAGRQGSGARRGQAAPVLNRLSPAARPSPARGYAAPGQRAVNGFNPRHPRNPRMLPQASHDHDRIPDHADW